MMNRMMVLVLAAILTTGSAAEQIVSDFEGGADGWRVTDMNCSGTISTVYGTYPVTPVGSGGCEGGYIECPDPSGNCFYFDAPAKFLGDKSAYLGGRLTFCVRSSMTNWADGNMVLLAGAGTVLAAEIKPFPTASWQQITIPLGACYFRRGNKTGAAIMPEDLAAVLSDLRSLRISGEYGSIVAETSAVDSVMLISPESPGIGTECGVTMDDLLILAGQWLQTPTNPAADLWPDCRIDLYDFAILAERWLTSDPGCLPAPTE